MTLIASSAVRYEFALLEFLRDEPAWRAAGLVALVAIVGVTVWLCRRERASAGQAVLWGGGLLRLTAIAAVVVMVLGPQRRAAEVRESPSKVVVLVDTTQSMNLPAENRSAQSASPSRLSAALDSLAQTGLLATLAEQHEVEVQATAGDGRWRPAAEGADDAPPPDHWRDRFAATASTTRLGDAIARVIEEHQGRPLAGVVLISDGQNNSGRNPLLAAQAAAERDAVLHTVGLGPTTPGANLAVRDVLAPARAYPGDKLSITALIESTGGAAAGDISLYRHEADASPESAELIATQPLGDPENDGGKDEAVRRYRVVFDVDPGETGRARFLVRAPVREDESDADDNARGVTVEVVDRVLKVLLIAGGPSRDYRFLRDQLGRDPLFEADALLQSAGPGVGQGAGRTLTALPASEEGLAEYDVVVAFDPDWRALPGGEAALEAAVSARGTGLLYAPGPVHTPRWLGAREPSRLAAALPVVMPDRWLALSDSGRSSRTRSPVTLTPAGAEAEFLWITGDRSASGEAWRAFPGFYRCFPIQSIKPGATVYARTDSPTESEAPGVLLAGQFYGAGRVMFLSSSELWRLRADNPSYFTSLTTKLLQHLAQGRLSANAPGGSLLFEQARVPVGETVVLRATGVRADEDRPLDAQVVMPDGSVRRQALMPSEQRPGAWAARWRASTPGRRRVVLPVGRAELTASLEVIVPAVERGAVVRDREQLERLAATGGGRHYPTFAAAVNGLDGLPPLPEATPSRAESTVVFGQPDPRFGESVSRWALGVIAGCLIGEWLLRRLNRLA